MNQDLLSILAIALVISPFAFLIVWAKIKDAEIKRHDKLLDDLIALSNMHGLNFIDVLRNSPSSGYRAPKKLEDIVDYILKNSKRAA